MALPLPLPLVRSAHVITSATATGPCQLRRNILAGIHAAVGPLTVAGRVEQVDGFEPEDVQRLLTAQQQQPIVDVEPSHVADPSMRALLRSLHLRQISNALKHVLALRKIAAAGAESGAAPRFALVLEDDAAFGDTMPEALARAARDAPADADIVFLGLPSGRAAAPGFASPALFDDPLAVFGSHALPACESYLVTPAGAARIAAGFMPIRFATPTQLTYLARGGLFRAYVAVPNAFVDSSKLGVVVSSVETNNQLLWNQPYCRADALVRGNAPPADVPCEPPLPPGTEPTYQAVYDALWEQQPFKTHPDVLVLHAEHLARTGRVDEALDAFARALQAFEAGGCVVNSTSAFLARYMALHGRRQEADVV
jgi:hypothetical protein